MPVRTRQAVFIPNPDLEDLFGVAIRPGDAIDISWDNLGQCWVVVIEPIEGDTI